jgi:hypothetical protein
MPLTNDMFLYKVCVIEENRLMPHTMWRGDEPERSSRFRKHRMLFCSRLIIPHRLLVDKASRRHLPLTLDIANLSERSVYVHV